MTEDLSILVHMSKALVRTSYGKYPHLEFYICVFLRFFSATSCFLYIHPIHRVVT
jgi:hypothetical protein